MRLTTRDYSMLMIFTVLCCVIVHLLNKVKDFKQYESDESLQEYLDSLRTNEDMDYEIEPEYGEYMA